MTRTLTNARGMRALAASALVMSFAFVSVPAATAYDGATTFVDKPGKAVVNICKELTPSIYGNLWKVKVYALTSRGYVANATVDIWRNNVRVNGTQVSARDGQWLVRETYASRDLDDTISGTYGWGTTNGSGAGGAWDAMPLARIATCN